MNGIIYCALFIYLVAASFINQEVYAFTVRYDSLLIFLVLIILALPHLLQDLKNKDTDLILAALTAVLSGVFVLVTHSGYGAALIPSDLALICYVSKKINLSDRSILCLAFAGACPVILWYSHVRWSYNFNMAGFAFMLMAYFAMILVEAVGERLSAEVKDRSGQTGGTDLIQVYINNRSFISAIIFITAFILSMLYHSRTAMFGMLMFLAVYALFKIMLTNRIVYDIVFFLASIGAVAFTAIYIRVASSMGNITVLYKDIFSGREAIWRELWGAFLASPVTGIGSAYELKSFEIFEVHNGMFDILTVHGIIVFALVTTLIYRMFARVYSHLAGSSPEKIVGLHNSTAEVPSDTPLSDHPGSMRIARIALAAAFSMMFTSFFENYFTVPPYSLFFMTFILMSGRRSKG